MVVVWKKSARKGESAFSSSEKSSRRTGARAFGTTTNIRLMEREGREERRKEGKRAASILGSVCLLLFNSKQHFDTLFSTFCTHGYQTDTLPVDKGHKTHLEIFFFSYLLQESLQDNRIPRICVQSLLRQPASVSSVHFNDPFHQKMVAAAIGGCWQMLCIVVSI
jgi:hypothetical protein